MPKDPKEEDRVGDQSRSHEQGKQGCLCTTHPHNIRSRITNPRDTSNCFLTSRTHLLYYVGRPQAWLRLARESNINRMCIEGMVSRAEKGGIPCPPSPESSGRVKSVGQELGAIRMMESCKVRNTPKFGQYMDKKS